MAFMFEDLSVYKKSIEFVLGAYTAYKTISEKEIKGQIKRAALSIPLNLAEGNGRNTQKEKVQFYKTARGSLFECVPLLEICQKLGHISIAEYNSLYQKAEEIGKMLNGLIKSAGNYRKEEM